MDEERWKNKERGRRKKGFAFNLFTKQIVCVYLKPLKANTVYQISNI